MSQRRNGKRSASYGGNETVVCNRCSYQVPEMFGTNNSIKKYNFNNSMVQVISIGGGDCATKVGALCDRFLDMRSLVKTQVEKWAQ